MNKNTARLKIFFADMTLILMVVIWGSTFFMIKDIILEIDPIGMIFYRFTAAAVIIGVYLFAVKAPLFKDFTKGIIVGLCLWSIYVPQNIGMQYTTASNSGFITALYVAFMPLIAKIFNVRISAIRILSCLIAMAGLWFLTGGFYEMNKGDLITLFTPIGVTLYVLFSDRYLKQGMPPVTLCFQQFLVTGLASFIWMLIGHSSFHIQTNKVILTLCYLTFFATILTFVVYNFVQKITTPMKVALIFALEPVFAAAFAFAFGGETLNALQFFGGFLIVIAVVISEANLEQFRIIKSILKKTRLISSEHELAEEGSL